jgi:hypothetical protein
MSLDTTYHYNNIFSGNTWTTVYRKPKHITYKQAFKYQRDFDVMGLADKLLSKESIDLQNEGWQFSHVSKGLLEIPDDVNYTYISVNNKWGDYIIFIKQHYI